MLTISLTRLACRFFAPVRASMVEKTVLRAEATICSQSCGSMPAPSCLERRWPTGTRTTMESLPGGAAVGSMREGTLT